MDIRSFLKKMVGIKSVEEAKNTSKQIKNNTPYFKQDRASEWRSFFGLDYFLRPKSKENTTENKKSDFETKPSTSTSITPKTKQNLAGPKSDTKVVTEESNATPNVAEEKTPAVKKTRTKRKTTTVTDNKVKEDSVSSDVEPKIEESKPKPKTRRSRKKTSIKKEDNK